MASPLQPVFFKIKRSYVIDSTWILFHLKIHHQRGFEPNFGNFDTIVPVAQWETLHSSVIDHFPELEYQHHQLIYNGEGGEKFLVRNNVDLGYVIKLVFENCGRFPTTPIPLYVTENEVYHSNHSEYPFEMPAAAGNHRALQYTNWNDEIPTGNQEIPDLHATIGVETNADGEDVITLGDSPFTNESDDNMCSGEENEREGQENQNTNENE